MSKSSPRIVTAEEAVQAIRSHDDVVLANFCGEPRFLPMALLNRAHELLGVRIFHSHTSLNCRPPAPEVRIPAILT